MTSAHFIPGFFCHSQRIHSSTSSSWQQDYNVRFGPFSPPVLKYLICWQQPIVGQTVLLCSAVNTAKQKSNTTVGVVIWYGEHLPPLLLSMHHLQVLKEGKLWLVRIYLLPKLSQSGGNVLPSNHQKYVEWSGNMVLGMIGKTHIPLQKLLSLVWPGP